MATQEKLTREEEQALARRWRDAHDIAARDRLVLAHLPMGKALARRCKAHGVAREDLEQQAVLGLIKSADGFDPERGLRFSTFARWWVNAFLTEYVVRNAGVVRPSLRKGRGNRLAGIRIMSLDQPVGGGEANARLADIIADEGPLPDELATLAIDGAFRASSIGVALARLDQRSRAVVEGRFVEGAQLRVVGDRLGISKERVRQIEAAALKRLRQMLTTEEDA